MKNTKLKLALIGTVGVPAKYGGFETLAHQFVINKSSEYDITVYNSTHNYAPEERVDTWRGAKIKYIPFSANGCQSIIYDIASMIHALIFCDVLLILGVSGCLFLPFVKLFSNKRVIVNVDGLEWRRQKWTGVAKQFLIASEKMAIRFADKLVADNEAIQHYLEKEHGAYSELIEYGADHNSPVEIKKKDLVEFPFLKDTYAFKVARIEPENNLHIILDAYAKCQQQLPLVIVGNWERGSYGQSLRSKYASNPNIYLLDPIYDPCTLNLLRSNATIYLHGHSAGGTNPSLVEAMYLGLPILSFDVIYNQVTTERKAWYFRNAEELTDMLDNLNFSSLQLMASKMKSIADRRYCWNIIANKYGNLISKERPVMVPEIKWEFS